MSDFQHTPNTTNQLPPSLTQGENLSGLAMGKGSPAVIAAKALAKLLLTAIKICGAGAVCGVATHAGANVTLLQCGAALQKMMERAGKK